MIRFTAVFLAVLAVQEARADERCTLDPGPPGVRFEVKKGDVVHHNDRDREHLQRLAGSRLKLGKEWIPTGLTLDEIKLDLKVAVTARRLSNGSYCVALSGVSGSIAQANINVYIDSRYRPGSCQHASVLAHEHKHVDNHADAVRRYGGKMEQRLKDSTRKLGAFVAETVERGAESLQARLRREIMPIFRELEQAVERGDAALDSRESYQREQANCPNW